MQVVVNFNPKRSLNLTFDEAIYVKRFLFGIFNHQFYALQLTERFVGILFSLEGSFKYVQGYYFDLVFSLRGSTIIRILFR